MTTEPTETVTWFYLARCIDGPLVYRSEVNPRRILVSGDVIITCPRCGDQHVASRITEEEAAKIDAQNNTPEVTSGDDVD